MRALQHAQTHLHSPKHARARAGRCSAVRQPVGGRAPWASTTHSTACAACRCRPCSAAAQPRLWLLLAQSPPVAMPSVICCIAERSGPQCSAARSASHRSRRIGSVRPTVHAHPKPFVPSARAPQQHALWQLWPAPPVLSVAERSPLAVDRPAVAYSTLYSAAAIGRTGL